MPQEVTSSWAGREGINRQQEVAPRQAERSPPNSPEEFTLDLASWVEMNIQAKGGSDTGFSEFEVAQRGPGSLAFSFGGGRLPERRR